MKKNNLYTFAEEELKLLGEDPDMVSHILKMVKVFAEEGHSGFSANYAVNLLSKILKYEPLTPLTGEDNEGTPLDYDPDMKFQNKRRSHVFKRADGSAYNSQFYIFQDKDGSCFTNSDSSKDITFPYVPRKEYILRDDQ